ncbi:MAG TPA: arginine deiminase-related protein [Candidatus Saccharimonadales bacterium]|nr:arginine deiminase-related protein [Candidatus Saccharimonadales bacterium]
MSAQINKTVLMSGVDYFDDAAAINPFMDSTAPIDLVKAKAEHDAIRQALESAGVTVIKVDPPAGCQDGVYTANWALVRGDQAVMSSLPNARKGEEAYAEQVLQAQGKTTYRVPDQLRFSGQGDALPVGNYLLAGSTYRTDPEVHQFLADVLGYDVISLQTVPQQDEAGQPVTNAYSGWPDSFFYDIDLAISVLTPNLIAWCPTAFTPESQEKILAIPDLERIEVSFEEAKTAFACNLVSTGETVVMSADAPHFKAAIESKGLKVITPEIKELVKGGGYIRCTTLTLDNE